jgi:hypothetical protein
MAGVLGCVGDRFIFPNFMLNFGINWGESLPKGRLTLLVNDSEALVWPAVFEPPAGMKLPATDGAHRSVSLQEMVDGNAVGIDELLGNAVGVTIVMEAHKDFAHQDFADCAKARPISDSIRGAFDVRDMVGKFARDLVLHNGF